MHPVRKRQLLTIVFIMSVIGLSLMLVMYAMRDNISLFYTPSDVYGKKPPLGRLIRVGGMVVKGSVVRASKGLETQFKLTDFTHEVDVRTQAILPDLFREGQGVIAKGKLNAQGIFEASEVLAKHDENYMPPELKGMIKAPNKGV